MTTRDKLTFVHAMARSTRATVRQCEALLRYSAALWMLERDHSLASIAKRDRIRRKVTELCREIEERESHEIIGSDMRTIGVCVPVFAGPVLKIRAGGGEIVCPS